MSREKEFEDAVITSVRAERKDLDLAKALGIRCSVALRNGIRNLAEGYLEGLREVPSDWRDLVVDLKKRDYEDTERRFRSEEQSRKQVAELITIRENVRHEIEEVTPTPGKTINWLKVPADKKLPTYIQTIMEQDFRAFWISKYNTAEEDDKFDVLNQFADDVICRHKADENKPFKLTDKIEIRKVLRTWADSVRGFQ